MNDHFDWDERAVALLTELWLSGLSTGKIGKRMGISKNGVVGKAKRLGLPARPSPLKPRKVTSPFHRGHRGVVGPTLPPLLSEMKG